jgi:hypothetical protein
MQFSPRSVFLAFRSKYPPQHCSQKPSVWVPQREKPRFTPIRYNRQSYSFFIS